MTNAVATLHDYKQRLDVLILDDDPVDAKHLQWLLAQLTGFAVNATTADNARSAAALFETRSFDIVFADFWLGNETSVEFIASTGGRARGIPVIMVTSLSVREIRNIGFGTGVSTHLPKSTLSVDSVEAAIENALQAAENAHQLAIREAASSLPDNVGSREKMLDLIEQIRQTASQSGNGCAADVQELCNELVALVAGVNPDDDPAEDRTSFWSTDMLKRKTA